MYNFKTDNDSIYACSFSNITSNLSPILGIYDIEIYDFDFFPIDNGSFSKTLDFRISITLANLISKLFSNPNRALVYVCDSSDGRGKERRRLFNLWRRFLPNTISLHQLDISIDEVGNTTAHGGILRRNDFPYPHVLETELVDNVRGIIFEKYGGSELQ